MRAVLMLPSCMSAKPLTTDTYAFALCTCELGLVRCDHLTILWFIHVKAPHFSKICLLEAWVIRKCQNVGWDPFQDLHVNSTLHIGDEHGKEGIASGRGTAVRRQLFRAHFSS